MHVVYSFVTLFFFNCTYLFIVFGYAGSLLLHRLSLVKKSPCSEQGLFPSFNA